ncbi:MAG: type I-E CRISPR-associated protein Cas7/Cse4/CasC, partial [Bacteroidota bacterium]
MKIELHIIQNFAPSNLNRDDSGNPKDCEFGGYRRARISSQCFKRAIHSYLDNDPELGGYMGIESKKLPIKIIEKLNEKGKNEKQVLSVVQKVLGVEFDKKNKKKTACILFLPSKCDEIMSNIIEQEWDHLFNEKGEILESDGLKRVEKEWEKLLKRKDVIDLALFGRMIADKPESKVEGATQFAHAISTNRVKMDTDF